MPDETARHAHPEVMAFLLSRRSRPARSLAAPGPDGAALRPILTAALRVPDHGKLEPWRFVVSTGGALGRLADATARLGAERGMDPDRLAKSVAMFRDAPCLVSVVAAPVASDAIPEAEQVLSAGAVCLGLVNAAAAAGWGANWLSGWTATDRGWLSEAMGLGPTEWVAGHVVLGTPTAVPPDRPRPDLDRLTEWRDA